MKKHFLIFIIFLGCSQSNQERLPAEKLISSEVSVKYNLESLYADTLSLSLGFTDGYMDFQTIEKDGEEIFIGLNEPEFSLDFISLSKKASLYKISLEDSGPNQISGNLDGFFYHNNDSIFILSIDANSIYLIDSTAEVKDKFHFSDTPLPDGFNNYDVYADQGIQNGPYYVSSQQALHFYTYRWLPPNKDDFNYSAFASYNIKKRAFENIYGVYPSNYQLGTNFLLYNDPTLTVVDTLSFVQLGASATISKYNNITGELLGHTQSSCEHWQGDPKALRSSINDFQIEQEWLVGNNAYIFLIPNPEEKLLYRFLKHQQPIVDNEELLNKRWFGPWCITIYDYDLNIVGHKDLQKNAFFPPISFASKNNIWIKNPSADFTESQSLFYRLKLNKENGKSN